MKYKFLLLFLVFSPALLGQKKAGNLVIITLDGLRWQEVFKGMDTAIANDPAFNQEDSEYIYKKFWHTDAERRRELLMPFLWSTIRQKGQIWGNRLYGNKIDNANPYWFSYPGYNEIMTGYPDTAINSNDHPPNPHITVLEFFNRQPGFKGRVAAFTAWDAFDRILNEKRAGFPVIAAFDTIGGKHPTSNERMINRLKNEAYKPFHDYECLDVFTHHAAMEYLKNHRPRLLYISYGETDEWAHAGQYRDYLNAANQVDAWLKQLWNFIQGDPLYKNNTTLFITVDHGRGDIIKKEWTSHNNKIQDSHEIWFAAIGTGIQAKGEVKSATQLYQKQFAQSFARLLGFRYKAAHPVAEEIIELFQ